MILNRNDHPALSTNHHRRSIRLQEYDYSQVGAYFITLCTQNKACLFGKIAEGAMHLNRIGLIVAEEWMRCAVIRQEIELDEWVVMPNHIHGIVIINHAMRTTSRSPLQDAAKPGLVPKSLGSLVGGFKAATTKRINEIRHTPGIPVWQRNYYEHVIRNEDELSSICQYIEENPLKWEMDRENPEAPISRSKVVSWQV